MSRNVVRSIVVPCIVNPITIRPRKGDENYPTHEAVRVVIGDDVHLVQKHEICELHPEALFYPEQRWKKCPNCRATNWSGWMPVSWRVHQIEEGFRPEDLQYVHWLVVCVHCTTIIAKRSFPPYVSNAREYVYDPADDTRFTLLEGRLRDAQPRRRRA